MFTEKEPAKILKKYREITYIKQEGAKEPEGKIRIGVLKTTGLLRNILIRWRENLQSRE